VGKICQKFGESSWAFKVVKEGLDGDAGADEDGVPLMMSGSLWMMSCRSRVSWMAMIAGLNGGWVDYNILVEGLISAGVGGLVGRLIASIASISLSHISMLPTSPSC
jgi:hypothetical protein